MAGADELSACAGSEVKERQDVEVLLSLIFPVTLAWGLNAWRFKGWDRHSSRASPLGLGDLCPDLCPAALLGSCRASELCPRQKTSIVIT